MVIWGYAMKKDEDLSKETNKDKDELLDFEFDDLSNGDVEAPNDDSPLDEEIIELDDIVEAGELLEDDESEEVTRVLDEEETVQKTEGTEADSLSSIELDQVLEEEASEDLALDLDAELEGMGTSEMDLIGPEKGEEDSESEEIARLLDGEESIEQELSFEEETDLASIESDQPPGADSSQVVEMQLDAALENLEASEKDEPELELLESDLESVPDVELLDETEFDISGLEEPEAPELELEEPEVDITPAIPHEDLSQVPEKPDEEPVSEEVAFIPSGEGTIEISEEKIEAIITRVVQNVVEKVARETMTTVAEKLITEAIDTLKESLESPLE